MRANKTEPFTLEEGEHIKTIYYTRKRLFYNTFIPLFILGTVCAFSLDTKKRVWTKKNNGDNLVTRNEMYLINFIFLQTLILSVGYGTYNKRIKPLKQDLDSGIKELVPYEVIRKTYFPQTNQYFISFDNPDYMHHEVDSTFFNNINEGDVAYIARGLNSKQVFDMNGKFTIM